MTFAHDPKSVSIQREGLAIRKKHFGDEHPLVAESMGNLGYALWHGADPPQWAEAEENYRGALAMYRRLGLQQTRDAARFSFSLAVMCRRMKRNEESESLFRDSLAVYRELPAGGDRYMVECLQRYASLLKNLGRYDEAGDLLRESVAATPEGVALVSVYRATWRLGQLAHARKRYVEAEREYRDAMRQECEFRQAVDPAMAEPLGEVFAMLTSDVDPDDTGAQYPAIFHTFFEITPSSERGRLVARMRDITNLLIDTQRYAEAEQVARACLKRTQKMSCEGTSELALARSALGECLAKQSRYESA